MKKFLATVSAVVLSLAMVALPSISATATQPDFICPSYAPNGTDKIDTVDDPATVPYTAPAGYLVDYYCVKAGSPQSTPNPKQIIDVIPPAASITIDHTEVGSVSHYSVHLIPIPVVDLCDNIEGDQAEIPNGMVLSANGTSCETPPTDVCDNIQGNQSEVPNGMVLAENGTSCEEPEDPGCDDLTGAKGFSISVDVECPKLKVEVSGSAKHQTCEASGDESVGTPVNGSITLTVSDLDGVTKIEYEKDNSGSLIDVPLNDLTIDDLAPGSYKFFVTVDSDYESVAPFTEVVKATHDPECKKQTICHWTPGGQNELGKYVEIDVSIKSIINLPNGHDTHPFDIIPPFDYYDGDDLVSYLGQHWNEGAEGCDDFQFPTDGPVTPEVVFTPATCDAGGSYTLISPAATEGLPAKTVTWFVNGVETEQGTYPVEVGESVTVRVVANAPSYILDYDLPNGFVTEYTYPAYEFTAPTACDLTTLALTGSDSTPALALTAFLGLLGLAMVRSGMRVNRNRQEA